MADLDAFIRGLIAGRLRRRVVAELPPAPPPKADTDGDKPRPATSGAMDALLRRRAGRG